MIALTVASTFLTRWSSSAFSVRCWCSDRKTVACNRINLESRAIKTAIETATTNVRLTYHPTLKRVVIPKATSAFSVINMQIANMTHRSSTDVRRVHMSTSATTDSNEIVPAA